MPPDDCSLLFDRVPRGVRRRGLRKFARLVQDRIAGGRGFSCLLTRDAELRRLNRDFLRKDCPTDVLSFPARGKYLGDIAISWERAREQARRFGHAPEEEIEILMLHGLLHLLGLDHENDRGRMRRLETRWRKELGLPSGLIERVRR